MKKNRNKKEVKKFALLCIYTAILPLLFLNNLSLPSSFTTSAIPPLPSAVNQEEEQTTKALSQEDASREKGDEISAELSLDAVFSALSLHLPQTLVLLYSFEFSVPQKIFIPFAHAPLCLPEVENTFCRHIAINAP